MAIKKTIIIGANSEIGQGLARQIFESEMTELVLVSRRFTQSGINDSRVKKIELKDYQTKSIDSCISQLQAIGLSNIDRVFVCNGILHNDQLFPEKSLQDFNVEAFHQVLNANTLTPMLWIQKLYPLLVGATACKFVIFSARVGSISDNRLGGWYSYRASKAALNMLIKTASIELARKAKNIKLIAFHPGTTDSPLSKPFQKNVPKDKLFTTEFVAKQVLDVVKTAPFDNTASYLDWQGKTIEW